MKSINGKSAQALQILGDLFAERQANMGSAGTPRVLLREWYEAISAIEPTRPHRARLKKTLLNRGFIRVENGFVEVMTRSEQLDPITQGQLLIQMAITLFTLIAELAELAERRRMTEDKLDELATFFGVEP